MNFVPNNDALATNQPTAEVQQNNQETNKQYDDLKTEIERTKYWMKKGYRLEEAEVLAKIEMEGMCIYLLGVATFDQISVMANLINKVIVNENKRQALITLYSCGLFDFINNLELLKDPQWLEIINSFDNEYQAKLVENIISYRNSKFGNQYKIRSPQQIKMWIEATNWVDTDDKCKLMLSLRWFITIDDMAAYKSIVEEICLLGEPVISKMYTFFMNLENKGLNIETARKELNKLKN
ncbi:MAG TPA: hypothetical protein PLH37_03170 [bacterium]|nr:hypothetical protein [bacterium]